MTDPEAPTPPTAARLLLWGPPCLLLPGQAARPLKAERRSWLLALLGVEPGRWWPREQIAALFWPEHASGAARRNLRKLVFLTGEALGGAGLQADEHALRWVGGSDLASFLLQPDTGLRRGALLDGLDAPGHAGWQDWLVQQRCHWDGLWQRAAAARLSALRQAGDTDGLAQLAEAMLALDPLDEAATEALVCCQRACGLDALAIGTWRRHGERLRQELGGVPRAAAAPPAPQVPPAREGFVGRRSELRLLDELLARPDCRWLTLLGPGGVGKSRLARRWWQEHRPAVLWIDLQDLTQSDAVPTRLAQALGVPVGPPEAPLGPLLMALEAQREPPCWVLDNAEHLAGLGALLAELLRQTTGLRLLVTSRERLHAPPLECLMPLDGLARPDEDSRDAEAALSFDAVRLFAERVQAARPGFDLAGHLPAVLQLIDQVGGLPLAIEMAASLVRLMPPEQIAELLAEGDVESLAALASPMPQRPEHRSLQRLLESGWQRLSAQERGALEALAVAVTRFEVAAARALLDRAGAPPAIALLATLADRSWLLADAEGGFSLHPLVALRARASLAADPARLHALRRAHARHHLENLAALAPHAVGDTRRLAAIGGWLPELRQAWWQALADGEAALLAAATRPLWAWFEIENQQAEGVRWLEAARALPADGAAGRLLQVRLAQGLSMLNHRLGKQPEALQAAERGLCHAAGCGDTEAWVGCWLNAGSALWMQGQLPEARERFETALAIARRCAHPQCEAWALGNLGVVLQEQGESEAAERTLLEALAGSRGAGDLYNQAVHLHNLGSVMRDTGRHDAAHHWYSQLLLHAGACGLRVMQLYAELALGRLAFEQGRHEEAQRRLDGSFERARRHGKGFIAAASERLLLRLRFARGDAAGARTALRPLLAAASSRQDLPALVELLVMWAECSAALGETEPAAAIAANLLGGARLFEPQRVRLQRLARAVASPAESALQLAARLLGQLPA